MKIDDFDTDQRVLVIAEIGNNHEGDFNLAKELIGLAAEAGANAVKFQSIVPERLVSPNDLARIEQLQKFRLEEKNFRALREEAERLGIIFLSTPFDLDVVDFLDELVPAFKIASSDNNFFPLIDKVASKGKPILISLGLGRIAHARDLERYLDDYWRNLGMDNPGICFMHCVCAYPTPIEEAGLMQLDRLKALNATSGYSDHTLGIKACELAVARGARVVEKHFTKDKNQSSFRDHQLSADYYDFKQLVKTIRECEKYLGSKSEKVLQDCEKSNIKAIRRSARANKNIQKETLFSQNDLSFFRGNDSDMEIKLGLSLKAIKDINKGDLIQQGENTISI
jgi:N,N'-diacetyllegionaminate synthase